MTDPKDTPLPTSAQLLKSTVIAVVVASVILVTVVLPAEYAVDPTGIGSVLGLTRMGEIKNQLAEEAEAVDVAPMVEQPAAVGTETVPGDPLWRDQTEVEIGPDEAVELKLVMAAGDRVEFEWSADGGALNFNRHGDGDGESIEYAKGRAAVEGRGEIVAAFDGYHGWFWRNRSGQAVVVTLRTRGAYSEIKRTQ